MTGSDRSYDNSRSAREAFVIVVTKVTATTEVTGMTVTTIVTIKRVMWASYKNGAARLGRPVYSKHRVTCRQEQLQFAFALFPN